MKKRQFKKNLKKLHKENWWNFKEFLAIKKLRKLHQSLGLSREYFTKRFLVSRENFYEQFLSRSGEPNTNGVVYDLHHLRINPNCTIIKALTKEEHRLLHEGGVNTISMGFKLPTMEKNTHIFELPIYTGTDGILPTSIVPGTKYRNIETNKVMIYTEQNIWIEYIEGSTNKVLHAGIPSSAISKQFEPKEIMDTDPIREY
jgi:hypothetical protein